MTQIKCPSCGSDIDIPAPKKTNKVAIGCLIAALAVIPVLAITGLLAAIAIPSFVKARDSARFNACVNNMRILDSAKEQAALEFRIEEGTIAPADSIRKFMPNEYDAMACPAGGEYTVNPIGVDPECSAHGSLSDWTSR